MLRPIMLTSAVICTLAFIASGAARADLKICNKTTSKVSVAIGYKNDKGWMSEGWWPVPTDQCQTLLKGPLVARYYYVYAVDKNKGSWGGKSMFCIMDKAFTIDGIEDCTARSYLSKGFSEVDTQDKADWTINLTGEPQALAPDKPATTQQ